MFFRCASLALRPVATSAVFAVALTAFHLAGPSSVHNSSWFWRVATERCEEALRFSFALRESVGVFAMRPLMTSVMRAVMTMSGSAVAGFIGVIFANYFFAGLCIQHAARRLSAAAPASTLLAFGASFTVLFAFFSPVYSFEDLVQYAFIFLALAWLHERPLRSGLLLCLALLTRETSVLILPGLALALYLRQSPTTKATVSVTAGLQAIVLPAVFYLLYTRLLPFPDMTDRFEHWRFNFENAKRAAESLLSPVLALSVVVMLLSIAWRSQRESVRRHHHWIAAFVATLVLNTPLLFVAAKAREARLFALPLVFLWPLAGEWLGVARAQWREVRTTPKWWTRSALPALLPAALLTVLVTCFYHRTVAGSLYDGYRIHIILVTYFGAALHLNISELRRRRVASTVLAGPGGERLSAVDDSE